MDNKDSKVTRWPGAGQELVNMGIAGRGRGIEIVWNRCWEPSGGTYILSVKVLNSINNQFKRPSVKYWQKAF
jgi:hypothetical protein